MVSDDSAFSTLVGVGVAKRGLSKLPPPTKLCSFSCIVGDLLAKGCLVFAIDFFTTADAVDVETDEAGAEAGTSTSKGFSELVEAEGAEVAEVELALVPGPELVLLLKIEALNMLFFLLILSITSFIDMVPETVLCPPGGGGSKSGKIESEGPKLILDEVSVSLLFEDAELAVVASLLLVEVVVVDAVVVVDVKVGVDVDVVVDEVDKDFSPTRTTGG